MPRSRPPISARRTDAGTEGRSHALCLSHVLQGIDLRVGKGEVVGLFGRNGVGKTTVIKTIAGWVSPSRGEVLFEGDNLRGVAWRGVAPDRICQRGRRC